MKDTDILVEYHVTKLLLKILRLPFQMQVFDFWDLSVE